MTRDISRRNALSRGVALATTTLMAGLSGCSDMNTNPPSENAQLENTATKSTVTKVEPGPVYRVSGDGPESFQFPYFLYVPERTAPSADTPPLAVHPTAIPKPTDNHAKSINRAKQNATEGRHRSLADRLQVPLLCPAFIRPRTDPVNGIHNVPSLDRQTLKLSQGPLERVDLQLVNMIHDARSRLNQSGFPVTDDGVLMHGFSAAGSFTDAFAIIHPDEVIAAASGGNSMILLPTDEWHGTRLDYQVGVADLPEIIGRSVDMDAISEMRQFHYIGAQDTNPVLKYNDLYHGRINELAREVYGGAPEPDSDPTVEDKHTRWKTGIEVYDSLGIENSLFKRYPDVGHSSRSVFDDVIDFLGESVQHYTPSPGDEANPQ